MHNGDAHDYDVGGDAARPLDPPAVVNQMDSKFFHFPLAECVMRGRYYNILQCNRSCCVVWLHAEGLEPLAPRSITCF